MVQLADLVADPDNARLHPPRNRSAIRGSLERFGAARSIVADAAGVVRAGNGALREALEAGITEALVVETDGRQLVVVKRPDWSPEEAAAYGLADNRATDLSTFDPGALSLLVPYLQSAGIDFTPLGWQPWELRGAQKGEASSTARGGEEGDGDEGEPTVGDVETVTKPGDLWILGEHRLICADSLAEGTAERLYDGHPVDAFLTDPPYAIYGSATGVASDIADDRMVVPFFEAIFRLFRRHLRKFGHCYVHCDWRSWSAVWEGARRGGIAAKNCLVWDKGGSGLGANYANTHEFLFFGASLPKQAAMGDREGGQRPVYRSNILRFNRPRGDDRQHNAAKPVDMLAELVEASTDVGGVVSDLFCGSGSTLMACERVGRIARCSEVDPRMVDLAVRRWEGRTGNKATREGE